MSDIITLRDAQTRRQAEDASKLFGSLFREAIARGEERPVPPPLPDTGSYPLIYIPEQRIEPAPNKMQLARQKKREERRLFAVELMTRTQRRKPPPGKYTVVDLTQDVCHYPLTDDSPFLFCGQSTSAAPYCAVHTRLCYEPR